MLAPLCDGTKELAPLREPDGDVAMGLELGDGAQVVAHATYLVVDETKVGGGNVSLPSAPRGDGMHKEAWVMAA